MTVQGAQSRRSQEERSAATRERLLDATIDCLVDLGYGGTTTTEIVRRAGVSRGAQVHHFPTKAELVQNAVVHLANRRHAELRHEFSRLPTTNDPVSTTVDLLWSAYAGPLFIAALELTVAARTDPALKPALAQLEERIENGVETLVRETFGEVALRSSAMRDALELTAQMMHGLALMRVLEGGKKQNEKRLLETWKNAIRPLFEEAIDNKKGKAS